MNIPANSTLAAEKPGLKCYHQSVPAVGLWGMDSSDSERGETVRRGDVDRTGFGLRNNPSMLKHVTLFIDYNYAHLLGGVH